MALVVRAFPLKPDCTVEKVKAFIAELEGPRKQDVSAMHAGHGVTHESWYLQETPQGYLVIAIDHVEGDVAGSAKAFQEADSGFAAWFKQAVLDLTGVDPSTTPLGPPTTAIYEWSRDEQTRARFEPHRQ